MAVRVKLRFWANTDHLPAFRKNSSGRRSPGLLPEVAYGSEARLKTMLWWRKNCSVYQQYPKQPVTAVECCCLPPQAVLEQKAQQILTPRWLMGVVDPSPSSGTCISCPVVIHQSPASRPRRSHAEKMTTMPQDKTGIALLVHMSQRTLPLSRKEGKQNQAKSPQEPDVPRNWVVSFSWNIWKACWPSLYLLSP